MRVLVLSSIHPFPPSDGGKADIARRLSLLREFGAEILLLSWDGTVAAPEDEVAFRAISPGGLCFLRRPRLQNFFHPRLPYTARRLQWTAGELEQVVPRVREFQPELVLLEGIFAYGPLAQIFPSVTGAIPVVLRSQSVEHQFFRVMAGGATSWVQSAYFRQEAWRLRGFERRVLPKFDLVYQIAPEDVDFWATQGLPGHRLLPLYYEPPPAAARGRAPQWDLGYLASFVSPHKVEALRWFIERAWPKFPRQLRFSVAGSHAPELVPQLCAKHGAEFLGFVPDLHGYLSSCRVLLIPLHQTSGVLAKLLDMIASGASVLCTEESLRGYPAEIRRFVRTAQSADDFVREALALLERPLDTGEFSNFAERIFGRARYRDFYDELAELALSDRACRPSA